MEGAGNSPVREIQNAAKWRALERREKEMWGGPTPPQFVHEEDHIAFEGAVYPVAVVIYGPPMN